MSKLLFESSESDLALTENTQPALLLVSHATYTILHKQLGINAQMAAGHSVGEYAALTSAKVISFFDAVRAVRKRGQSMQNAVPVGEGGMLAILGLDNEQVYFLCKMTEEKSGYTPLSPANFNSPGQVVISGSMKAIEWLKANFKVEELPGTTKRVKLIPLNVSAPFHCALMKPAEEEMKDFLNGIEFKNAKFPVIQNYHAQSETDGKKIRENLIRQISAPVLWTQSILEMAKTNHTQCIECGHGKVLSGLVKKIKPDFFEVYSTSSLDDLKEIEAIVKTLSHRQQSR